MAKQCENYEFKVIDEPVKLWFLIKPFKDDMWTGFRIVANMGKRLSTELKGTVHAEAVTVIESHEVGVTFTPEFSVSKETMENAAHSIYLWLEHPEKY